MFLDAETDTLTDGFGGVWLREGAEVPEPAISGEMWPQSTLDEVRAAQERADAGDPDYTRQVDAQLAADDLGTYERLSNGQVEVVDRFLREVLGWEAYMQNVYVGGADFSLSDQRFLRCAPDRVEQEIYSHWDGGRSTGIEGGLALGGTTIENGQPVPMLFAQFDGEVTYSSPSQNSMDVGDDGLIDFTDPVVFWSECARGPVPADAAAFAQAVSADPNFGTTAPVAARVGGVEAVAMDVALSPAGRVCLAYRTNAKPLDPRAGTRKASTPVPRRPPGGYVDADPGDHRHGARGALRRRGCGRHTDHRLHRVPRTVMATG